MSNVTPTTWTLLSGTEDFPNTRRFHWHSRHRAFMLRQQQRTHYPRRSVSGANAALLNSQPQVFDPYGQLGRISPDGLSIEFNAGEGFRTLLDQDLSPITAPVGQFHHITLGGEGRLAAAYSDTDSNTHGVLLMHLAQRWQQHTDLPERANGLVIDRVNNLWAMGEQQLHLCQGQPLPFPYTKQVDRFEPVDSNPHALKRHRSQNLISGWQTSAVCCDDQHLYLLLSSAADQQAILRRELNERSNTALELFEIDAETLPFCTDIAVVEHGLALICPMSETDYEAGRRDCPIVSLTEATTRTLAHVSPLALSYPMLPQQAPRFVSTLDDRTRYQANDGPRELTLRAQARYPNTGRVTLRREMDSGSAATVWHRVYLDAKIPHGCRLLIYAAAYNDPTQRGSLRYVRQPDLLWSPLSSELAHTPNPAGYEPNYTGLFELLLQRPSGNVRQLRGRYLAIRLVFQTDGRRSPVIYNMRIHYPRVCMQQAYLPALFHQEEQYQTGSTAANGADVRERFLASFEGMLTPIETDIASAETLLYPSATPADYLPMLANMLGAKLPAQWPEARQRRFIASIGKLQQWRGTMLGVQLILDIMTDGGVARGEVVLVENFRLRRTMATLLGISMDDADHPLTLGTGQSGNSIVGDSLILSDDDSRAFLALFNPDLANSDEKKAVDEFFQKYSHRISILLHGNARSQRALVKHTLEQHMPAHVQWSIYETGHPFVLGLAPLLAVDTFIEHKTPPRPVVLNDTWLGNEGLINNPVALSPEDVTARGSI